jgi:branched-chain amino acid transport system permease protein
MKLLKAKFSAITFISIGVLLFLFLFPLIASTYILHILILVYMYISLSESWNMFSGLSGYFNFGHVVNWGIGAYVFALTSLSGLPTYLAILLSGLASSLFAICIGYPVLRLRGPYFAVTTLAVMSIVQIFVMFFGNVTGGSRGLTLEKLIVGIGYHKEYYYYYFLILAIFSVFLAFKFKKSKLGFGLMIIKQDEDAAESLGINTTLYKLIGYSVSSFVPGMTGALYAYLMLYIDPAMMFDVTESVKVILMVILGGVGTITGPILGVTLLSIVDSLLRVYLPYWHMFVYSLLLLILILYKPQGLHSVIKKIGGKLP